MEIASDTKKLVRYLITKFNRWQYNLPNTMFKAVVRSSREDEVAPSQLSEEAETLELWGVDDLHTKWVNLYVAMDGVIEHLEFERF